MSADVLLVVTDTDRRGAQVFATELHHALSRRSRSVRTVALAPGRVGGLDVPVLGRDRFAAETMRKLRREIRSARVAVGFGSATLPACTLAGAGLSTPFVYRSIGELHFWAHSPSRRIRVRWALRQASAVVVLWPDAAGPVVNDFRVPPDKIRVIPRGVRSSQFRAANVAERQEARRLYGLGPSAPTLLYVGALSPEKGVETAVRAVLGLPKWQLLLVGDGPDREMLERMAREGGDGRIRFAGSIAEPSAAFRAADVVVLPSRSEGMPGVLIEAGFAGLPSVATSVGGVPEIVVPGETGEFFAPGDPDGLAFALGTVLEDADRYGRAARQRCLERFEIADVAAAWDRLVDDLLSPSTPTGPGVGRDLLLP